MPNFFAKTLKARKAPWDEIGHRDGEDRTGEMPVGVLPAGDSGFAPVLCGAPLGRVILLERMDRAFDLERQMLQAVPWALPGWVWGNQEARQTGALFGLVLQKSFKPKVLLNISPMSYVSVENDPHAF